MHICRGGPAHSSCVSLCPTVRACQSWREGPPYSDIGRQQCFGTHGRTNAHTCARGPRTGQSLRVEPRARNQLTSLQLIYICYDKKVIQVTTKGFFVKYIHTNPVTRRPHHTLVQLFSSFTPTAVDKSYIYTYSVCVLRLHNHNLR